MMTLLGIKFWFWYSGNALFPTSIVELSKSSSIEGNNNPKLECGPKEGLSGWRVVRSATLRSQPQSGAGGPPQSQTDYWAAIELYKETGETVKVDVPLKSYAAYKQLEEYCQARQGKCYEKWTNDTAHPTYGFHLITFPNSGTTQDLFLYRPHFYHYKWKFDLMVYGLLSFLATLDFWIAAPNLRSLGIIALVYLLSILLGGVLFYFFGAYDLVGACGTTTAVAHRPSTNNNNRTTPSNHDYVDLADNPGGLTSDNYNTTRAVV